MPFRALITNMLDHAVESLKEQLKVLEPQMKQNKDGMLIAHNGINAIRVYASIFYKAYIPKSFSGWQVQFIEWDGGEIDLDKE